MTPGEFLAALEQAFAEARERTLREGLTLSPPERLALAEELWLELTRGQMAARPWTHAFDTFDQYEQWRRQGVGRIG